ncbi:hypothetical protein [Kosakonia sp.]|uniref:hypothetical protein n=1 Tax=Kosakonia sp. TaxID=1916651 RepID=UPI00289E9B39|nr:hypothetical protein [Kosakonia sp.]
MTQHADLDTELENRITMLVEAGNIHHERANIAEALAAYQQAWALLPEPRMSWSITSWVAACLYSACFDLQNFTAAKTWGEIALAANNSAIDTAPLIDLGMVCYELKAYDEALNYFAQAWQYGQRRAFQGRPQKYLDYFLQNRTDSSSG